MCSESTDLHYVNVYTGELKLTTSELEDLEFESRYISERGWQIITARQYAIYCQVAIWALKKSIS